MPTTGKNQRRKILIIEDEKDLAALLEFHFHKEGCQVEKALDGVKGLEAALSDPPDLIVLDLMLPGLMGLDVFRQLKKDERTSDVPVIILTAKGEEESKVAGFELGADDYVVKPFSIREFLLRVKAVLRRSSPDETGETITIGPITLDASRHVVLAHGQEVSLTTTEFKLLYNLAQRPAHLQSRDTLLKNVWGYSYVGDTRTVDTHITRLRAKLGRAGDMIKTVRGFGYKLEEE